MKFIEALKLRSKLFFLFMLITMGLVIIGIMGYLNINSMKKNLDSLYFGSLVPVTELNEILQIYHGSIANTIYKARNTEISSSQTTSEIENALLKIEMQWRNYESHFKRDEELQYVQYTALEIKATNEYFKKILNGVLSGETIENISMENFEKRVEHIHSTVKKLINYEVEVAKYERKSFLSLYEKLIQNVGIILSIIILGVLIISYYVFKSIQNDHTKLEITTKKLRRANKKLENVSYTDVLTSLHNRRYFNFVYDRELKRAKRTKSYITFMMLDIDFFKQYNDTYGHIEGDFALKSVAKVLKDSLKRPSDYVFRLGGEEFGVLLIDTDESNSARLAREICDSIRLREIKHETSKVNEFLTISIGVVCCVADEALNEDILISRADEMLYKAKESGRDGYIITTNVSEATVLESSEQIGA
ncbi:diguanylate cyclase [Sulfurimonas sp.]|uniref:diguanylate cyclase n=1 Tax=Sulfurimonas sp. TaxID=2022749 RepID=UPI0025D93C08|nr:diguanylate cyclase [Sulfurimonas sp.]